MERRKLVECVSIVDDAEEDMPLFVPFGFKEKIPICMRLFEFVQRGLVSTSVPTGVKPSSEVYDLKSNDIQS
jgi:hypothetical protein